MYVSVSFESLVSALDIVALFFIDYCQLVILLSDHFLLALDLSLSTLLLYVVQKDIDVRRR